MLRTSCTTDWSPWNPTRDVAVFADYQLLAAMGQLLMFLKAPETVEALPLETVPLAVFQFKDSADPPQAAAHWLRASE